jgi:uncharacterized protein HemY
MSFSRQNSAAYKSSLDGLVVGVVVVGVVVLVVVVVVAVVIGTGGEYRYVRN